MVVMKNSVAQDVVVVVVAGAGIALTLRYFAVATPVAVAALGVFLIGFGYLKVRSSGDVFRWRKTTATIEEASVGVHQVLNDRSGPLAYYSPAVRYTYVHEGRTHSSDCVARDPRGLLSRDRRKVLRLVEMLRSSPTISVYVNPANPEEAVIYPGMSLKRLNHYYAFIFAGILLLALGFALYQFADG